MFFSEEKEKGSRDMHTQRIGHERTRREDSIYKPRTEASGGLRRNQTTWHLDLELPASRTVKK